MITRVTSTVTINLKWRKYNNLFKPLIKENIKYIKFTKFFNYCTHNGNEIKQSPKIRMDVKGTCWNWNTKENFMARYFHNCTVFEGVPFEQHEELYELNFLNLLKKSIFCQSYNHGIYRSSRLEVFCKKGVLINFAKFRGKHLCQSLLFNKVADLRQRDSGKGVFLWILWNF